MSQILLRAGACLATCPLPVCRSMYSSNALQGSLLTLRRSYLFCSYFTSFTPKGYRYIMTKETKRDPSPTYTEIKRNPPSQRCVVCKARDVAPFNTMKDNRWPPMTRANLGCRTGQRVLRFVEAGLLWGTAVGSLLCRDGGGLRARPP